MLFRISTKRKGNTIVFTQWSKGIEGMKATALIGHVLYLGYQPHLCPKITPQIENYNIVRSLPLVYIALLLRSITITNSPSWASGRYHTRFSPNEASITKYLVITFNHVLTHYRVSHITNINYNVTAVPKIVICDCVSVDL